MSHNDGDHWSLVGGLEHCDYVPIGIMFPLSWGFHNPNWWTHIFQRGRHTTKQNIDIVIVIHQGYWLQWNQRPFQEPQLEVPTSCILWMGAKSRVKRIVETLSNLSMILSFPPFSPGASDFATDMHRSLFRKTKTKNTIFLHINTSFPPYKTIISLIFHRNVSHLHHWSSINHRLTIDKLYRFTIFFIYFKPREVLPGALSHVFQRWFPLDDLREPLLPGIQRSPLGVANL